MQAVARRIATSGLTFWLIITLIGSYFVYHLDHFITFGIDLVGGIYLRLEVQTDKAIETELRGRVQSILQLMRKGNRPLPKEAYEGPTVAVLTFTDEEQAQQVATLIAENDLLIRMANGRLQLERKSNVIRLTIPADVAKQLAHEAVAGNIAVIRARVDSMGVGEIPITPAGERGIVIEFPNIRDPEEAKRVIGKTALLEFKVVEDVGSGPEELLNRYGGTLPEGMMIIEGKERLGSQLVYLVPVYTDVTGRLLKDAFPGTGGKIGAEPVVKFRFNAEGGEKFYELTRNNLGRQLAVIFDGKVITAPVVQAAIRDEGEITGSFSMESARELAMLLKSGSFIAPVTFEEERTIGPALGAASISQGLRACIVGLVLLFFFSIIVYKAAGLFAFIVLLYNLLLILFALAWLGATLTLPGIAGMVLTVGMAIDASILIYERIREELADGAPFRKAVNSGFAGALAVILDANITHFLVALVLYKLGTGPIQGFAVTMIIGIASTLVTGLLLLRSIFTFMLDIVGVHKISI